MDLRLLAPLEVHLGDGPIELGPRNQPLWRGEPLCDLVDEPFAAAEIRRLDELRLRATAMAIEDDLAGGRHDDLIGELETLVAAHPSASGCTRSKRVGNVRSHGQWFPLLDQMWFPN